MRIDSSGRLLVGATTNAYTSAKLQVASTTSSTLFLYNTNTSASGLATLAFGPSNSITGAQIKCNAEEDFSTSLNRTANLSFEVRKDGSINEAMRIDSSGNVGIGTSSPDSILHAYTGSAGSVSALSGTVITAENNGNAFVSILSPDANLGALVYGSPSNSNNASINGYYNGGSQYLNFNVAGSEKLRIDSSGNVGIGESTPIHKLDVKITNNTTYTAADFISNATARIHNNSTTDRKSVV